MADEKTVDLVIDGVMETCSVEVDQNEEFICTAENGRFVKFPKGTKLAQGAKAHNQANPIAGD